MGRIAGRLQRLEREAATDPQEQERAIQREVMRRMTDEELYRYGEVLTCLESGSEVEDLEIVRRVEELTGEVRSHPVP